MTFVHEQRRELQTRHSYVAPEGCASLMLAEGTAAAAAAVAAAPLCQPESNHPVHDQPVDVVVLIRSRGWN